jgi:hypothetical protein
LLVVIVLEFYSVWRALLIAIHNGCFTSIRDIAPTSQLRKQRSFIDTRQHTGLDLSGHKRRGH